MSKTRFLTLAALAATLMAALVACDATGYYRPTAEAECRARGLAAGTDAFSACVKAVEDAEYRRWARGLPGH
jgi:pyruvate-formate lyase-activating enzyme